MTVNPPATLVPEDFPVEGAEREEGALPRTVERTVNKKKKSQGRRWKGEENESPTTGKTVAARNVLKPRCNGATCGRFGKRCSKLSKEEREENI